MSAGGELDIDGGSGKAVSLARANLQEFLTRNLLQARIRDLRRQAAGKVLEQALFDDDAASRSAVADQYAFEFHAQARAPSQRCDGPNSSNGHIVLRRHCCGRVGAEFLCPLPGSAGPPGPVLAVEHQGADRWAGAGDDRLVGGLGATRSEGRCRFVMGKDRRWEWIDEALCATPLRPH